MEGTLGMATTLQAGSRHGLTSGSSKVGRALTIVVTCLRVMAAPALSRMLTHCICSHQQGFIRKQRRVMSLLSCALLRRQVLRHSRLRMHAEPREAR